MYILKHALKNIGRNKGRNCLLLIVSLLIIMLSAIAMLLHNYATKSANYYASTYASKVSVITTPNEEINVSTLLSFTNSSLLNRSEQIGTMAVFIKNSKPIDAKDASSDTIKWMASSHPKIEEAFESGEKKIISGKIPNKEKEVLISTRLAKQNQLQVGDSLIIQVANDSQSIKFTISGIYNNTSLQANDNPLGTTYSNPWNEIYTNFDTMKRSSFFETYAKCSITLFLKNPSDLSKLREELLKKGMPTSYLLIQDTDTYNQKMQPVHQLVDISNKLMYATIGVGSLLLILISVMTIRDRKYEVGVLRAMGMKKTQLAKSFLYESFTMTILALILSLSSASYLAKPIMAKVIQQENTTQENINTSLSKTNISNCTLLSLGLALLSSTGGLCIIMRYEPRKILTEKD